LISQGVTLEKHNEIIIKMIIESEPQPSGFLPNSPQLSQVFASRKYVSKKQPFSMFSESTEHFLFTPQKAITFPTKCNYT